jgi:vitamin B12 transporter
MKHHLWFRLSGSSLVAPAILTALLSAQAQTPEEHLTTYVVSATRTPQDPKRAPSCVSLLPAAELQVAQIADLRSALAGTPGVAVVNTGAIGGQSSIFIRGANSDQTLFVVDGVRMSDRSAAYQNFLGGADLSGLDRVEVLRGPQSTLYGSSAMGGVILLETARGAGRPSGMVAATAGSFATASGMIVGQGSDAGKSYSCSLVRTETANDRPDNDYRMWSYSTRVEGAPAEGWLIGATLRGQRGRYEEPGSRLYPSPGVVDADNHLVTAYGQWRMGGNATSRLTVAWHQREFDFSSTWGLSSSRNVREIVDWQNTWTATKHVEVVIGGNVERSRYNITGSTTDDRMRAAYLSTTARVLTNLVLTGGLRYDNFKSVGSAVTGRAGAAWLPGGGTKLRATFGTGFNAPGSDDRFGVPLWNLLPNPGLRPEKSRGWDAGVDQDIAGGAATLSATYFQNRFTDLFDYDVNDFTFAFRTVNRVRAYSEGIEMMASVRLGTAVQIRFGYTYLDAFNDQGANRLRLNRRPRHTTDGEVRWRPAKAWLLGAGVHGVADRIDRSLNSNASGCMEDYTTVRLFLSHSSRSGFALKLRIENALNERYEEVYGYPALSRGAFGSIEWGL